jgi:pectate lyase
MRSSCTFGSVFVCALATILLLGTGCAAAQAPAKVVAFPGAEGFGAVATGGRGGKVIKVTTLKPTGPGSLNEAVQTKGPRIVVFDVSGVIKGRVTILEPDLTIAGQTAPGAGITIEGVVCTKYRLKPPANNIIIRFLRVRPQRPKGRSSGGDCLQLTNVDPLIVDHVSCSWGNDENMDLCSSKNLTVQWCAIEESDPTGHSKGRGHNFGMIMGYAGKDATLHHNLFAHHSKRAPLCGLEVMDHRNNVIYNMLLPFTFHPPRMNQSRPDKPFRINVIGNYFKDGPNVKANMKGRSFDRLLWKPVSIEPYIKGNYLTWMKGVSETSLKQTAAKPWPAAPVETQDAETAYAKVMAQVGCLPRDAVSKRMIEEVKAGTGKWGRHEPKGGLMEGLKVAQAPADADKDGMPDKWEMAHGLDPKSPADATKIVIEGASKDNRHMGYTYIEFYVNELADKLIAEAVEAAKTEKQ